MMKEEEQDDDDDDQPINQSQSANHQGRERGIGREFTPRTPGVSGSSRLSSSIIVILLRHSIRTSPARITRPHRLMAFIEVSQPKITRPHHYITSPKSPNPPFL